jgi:hypothetical protein
MRTVASTLAALLLLAGTAFAQGIAFVTNVKGEVAVDGAAHPPLLSELSRGQKIVLARDAGLSVMYAATGKEYVLKGPGEFSVKDTEIAAASGMPPAVRITEWHASGKVMEAAARSAAASVRMRSLAPSKAPLPVLVSPTSGSVATLEPTLRWRTESPVEVAIYIPGEEKAVHSATAAGGAYRLTAPLKPDTEYVWTVASHGREMGSGRFRTLPAEALRKVEHYRPADKSDFSDRVLFAVMLHELGAQQEAREAWMRLSEERADLPELATLAQ